MTPAEYVLVRRVRLRPEHLPVPVYTAGGEGGDVRPIPATWLGIIEVQEDGRRSYELGFYTDDGQRLEGLQFDSLDIALDQAADIVGVTADEWEPTDVPIPEAGDVPRGTSSE